MGNPLLDISVEIENKELLDKYGLELDNAILANELQVPLFEEIAGMNPMFLGGGAALNSIRASQWMVGHPGLTTFLGAVGKVGKDGSTLRNIIRQSGVDPVLQIIDNAPTGRCGVIVHNKERSLVTDIGAAKEFQDSWLDKMRAKSVIDKGEIFYVEGFFLDSSPKSVLKVGEYVASQENKTFILNISAEFVTTLCIDALNETIPYTDIIICNEREANAFAKSQGWETTDLEDIARRMTELPKKNAQKERVAIVTCGSKSTKIYFEGECHTVPVPKVDVSKIVDTNGAGDSFVGGFIAGLSRGTPYIKAIEAGHYCASYTIQRSGTSFSGEPSFGSFQLGQFPYHR